MNTQGYLGRFHLRDISRLTYYVTDGYPNHHSCLLDQIVNNLRLNGPFKISIRTTTYNHHA